MSSGAVSASENRSTSYAMSLLNVCNGRRYQNSPPEVDKSAFLSSAPALYCNNARLPAWFRLEKDAGGHGSKHFASIPDFMSRQAAQRTGRDDDSRFHNGDKFWPTMHNMVCTSHMFSTKHRPFYASRHVAPIIAVRCLRRLFGRLVVLFRHLALRSSRPVHRPQQCISDGWSPDIAVP